MSSSVFLVNLSNEILEIEVSPDHLVINGSIENSIDTVRKLIHWNQNKPFNQNYKLNIINQVDLFTIEAQNSLLKILEEPPIKSTFILTYRNLALLIPTIISRCMQVQIQNLNKYLIKELQNRIKTSLVYFEVPFSLDNIKSIPDALKQSRLISKKYTRDEILIFIDYWINTEMNKTNTNGHILDKLLDAKRLLISNTHVQTICDLLFIAIL